MLTPRQDLGSMCLPDGDLDLVARLERLPVQVLNVDVLARLSPNQKKALRGVCKGARRIVNALVAKVTLEACQLAADAPGGAGQAQSTFQRLAAEYPSLRALVLRDSKRVELQDADLVALFDPAAGGDGAAALLARLEDLDIKMAHFVTRTGVAAVVAALPGLQSLRLGQHTAGLAGHAMPCSSFMQ